LNARGIDRLPDEIISFCVRQNIDIILLTETYLLTGNLHTTWTQHHNYATKAPNAHRGHGGLSILIRPDFPHHFHPHPITNSYTIHGLYLPPQIDITTYRSILFDLSINQHTIILGDLNTRIGAPIGDRRINARYHPYREWLLQNQIINWNQSLAFGLPTYEGPNGTSIIDFS
jgi:hypothetical protein